MDYLRRYDWGAVKLITDVTYSDARFLQLKNSLVKYVRREVSSA